MSVKKIGLEDLRRIVREVYEAEFMKEQESPEEIDSVETEEVDTELEPDGSEEVDVVDSAELEASPEMPEMDEEEEADGEFELNTPEDIADALESVADLLARVADAIEDMGGTTAVSDEMDTVGEAVTEARRLIRKSFRVVLSESKKISK